MLHMRLSVASSGPDGSKNAKTSKTDPAHCHVNTENQFLAGSESHIRLLSLIETQASYFRDPVNRDFAKRPFLRDCEV